MNILTAWRKLWLVFLGDVLTLALVTLLGFATHDTLQSAGWRLLTTFLPLLAAWLLVAPHLGVFDPERLADPRQLWRPFWAMVLAGPLAAWLRGVWLNAPIIPIFVVVLGGLTALALLTWRAVYLWLSGRRKQLAHG